MPDSIFTGPPKLTEWQRQLIGMIPYVGPAYSAIRGGMLCSVFQPPRTRRQWPAPINSETNAPPIYGPETPTGGLPTNSETNAPPMYGSPASPMGPTGPNGNWRQVYNTGRFTNAPAFYTTLAQAQFPGSAIGLSGRQRQSLRGTNVSSDGES